MGMTKLEAARDVTRRLRDQMDTGTLTGRLSTLDHHLKQVTNLMREAHTNTDRRVAFLAMSELQLLRAVALEDAMKLPDAQVAAKAAGDWADQAYTVSKGTKDQEIAYRAEALNLSAIAFTRRAAFQINHAPTASDAINTTILARRDAQDSSIRANAYCWEALAWTRTGRDDLQSNALGAIEDAYRAIDGAKPSAQISFPGTNFGETLVKQFEGVIRSRTGDVATGERLLLDALSQVPTDHNQWIWLHYDLVETYTKLEEPEAAADHALKAVKGAGGRQSQFKLKQIYRQSILLRAKWENLPKVKELESALEPVA